MRLATLIIALFPALSIAQSSYNPDINGDNFVGAPDLLGILALFGDSIESNVMSACWLEIDQENQAIYENFNPYGASQVAYRFVPEEADIILVDEINSNSSSGDFIDWEIASNFSYDGYSDQNELNDGWAGNNGNTGCGYTPNRRGFILPDGCDTKTLLFISNINSSTHSSLYFVDTFCDDYSNNNCECLGMDANQARLITSTSSDITTTGNPDTQPRIHILQRWHNTWFVVK